MIETSWTKEQVEDLLKREKLAYQKIELPYGLSTGGKDRSETSARIFADGVKGKSVLDIGCFLGYFCHEAVRRGASRVVGIDVDENRLRQARQIADCLGMDIEFRLFDIEQEGLTEQFDVILMLNVLHHFRNPISVVDKLIPHTNDRLILEVASPSSARPSKLLKLTLSLGGDERRTVFAGIKKAYRPEDLVGRLVVMCANLAPRKMKFGISEGMILASGPGDKDVFMLGVDEGGQPGQRVH